MTFNYLPLDSSSDEPSDGRGETPEERAVATRHFNITAYSPCVTLGVSPVAGESRLLLDPALSWEDVERIRWALSEVAVSVDWQPGCGQDCPLCAKGFHPRR